MDLGLENRVALVAGGSSGLGLAVAGELAREGAHVAIGARDPDRLAAAERTVKEVARGRVHTTSVDITDDAAAHRWIDEVAITVGPPQILVVSGGSPPKGSATQFAVEEYGRAAETVLLPPVRLALGTLPHMRAAGWGRLLFVASETASSSIARMALSGVTRAAIVRFAQSLAADLGPAGITVNVLAPGATRTAMVERAARKLAAESGGDPEDQLHSMGAHSAVGRLGRPEEFAAMAAFLASERASFITGGVHLIDGGAGVIGPQPPYLTVTRKDIFT